MFNANFDNRLCYIYIFHYAEVIGDVEFFLPFGVAVHEELGSGKYIFFSVLKLSRKKSSSLNGRAAGALLRKLHEVTGPKKQICF